MERIEKEIAQRKEEIENGRLYVEKSLIQEFNEYNEKTRKALKEHVIETVEQEMNEMVQEIENLKQEIATKDLIISESSNINGDKISVIEQLQKQLQEKDNELKKIIANSNVIEKEIYK